LRAVGYVTTDDFTKFDVLVSYTDPETRELKIVYPIDD
jgi:hypothetical protein